MILSRDVVFFDEKLPLPQLTLLNITGPEITRPTSRFKRIAFRLDKFQKLEMISLLWCAVEQAALSHLTLVCNNVKLRPFVERTPPDGWGFRPIPEYVVRDQDPMAYKMGQQAVMLFRESVPGLTHEFVFEWAEEEI